MNTPNPLHPQGTFIENQGRSHVRIAVFTILAVHVVLLGALLLQGCKRTTTETDADENASSSLPPFEPTSNVFAPPPPVTTFAPPPEVTPVEPPPTISTTPPVETSAPPVVTTPPVVPPIPSAVTPPVPTAVTPPSEFYPPTANREHTVEKGDNFYTLAKKYGVSMKAISAANPGVDPRRLKIGNKLVIPPAEEKSSSNAAESATADGPTGTVYAVKSGDNLYKIARKYGTKVDALRRENNLRTDRLVVGQKLKIPASATKLEKK